ncbi:hypothetical protein FE257_011861 [Aspergillus nanangensis]|uniref:Heterokaryon incompatibility domain-containing protein n=1 Tax=Aspergillus nanangensis TaxID=2582783 RepID=A0AAD4CI93_ASPNN|nr:hypothetical protein FE257_011861 [Aspergillus nanangensis]
MLHPLHTRPGDWEKAQDNPDLRISLYTGPSTDAPDKKWEDKICSPRYELFLHDEEAESSDEAVNWTRSNLEHCCSSHPECNLEEPNWGLPTRVLDLGESNRALTSDVKLYVTHNEQEEYLSLSHCWGSEPELRPLETTTKTLDEFQDRICYDNLTKTFQDAVVFTRKLGYRFLWIDSLCIIQDDGDDWMREAGAMASIYKNSVFTLAAASSSDSGGGLFRKSNPDIRLGHPNQQKGMQSAARQFSNPSFFEYRPRPNGMSREKPVPEESSPLFQRAWVFQERILSRRVLYFTPLELVFECRVSNNTESGSSWIDSKPKKAFLSVYDNISPAEDISHLWHQLVADFTQLQLTMEKDTLPAMAGLARRFLQRSDSANPSSYFAGLWRGTFIDDMHRTASHHTKDKPQRINSGIPTWSWARSDDPKCYIQGRIIAYL